MVIPFRISCDVTSYSHLLSDDVFSLLTGGDTNIQITNVKERTFSISSVNQFVSCDDAAEFASIAHLSISLFLMALNVASLGHFSWSGSNNVSPLYIVEDPRKDRQSNGILSRGLKRIDLPVRKLTQDDVRKTALLYGALTKETDQHICSEYIKGIIHLNLDFPSVDFNKEAFANFYRSFEFLATERVLGVKKLVNDVKELLGVLEKYGLSDDSKKEFKRLYALRSEQIMHAQKKQRIISRDDVMKMKVLADLLLYKVYKPVWKAGLNI